MSKQLQLLSWQEVEDLTGWLVEVIDVNGKEWIGILQGKDYHTSRYYGQFVLFNYPATGLHISREEAEERVLSRKDIIQENAYADPRTEKIIPIRREF